MKPRYQDRVAIITGADSGIGLATGKRMASEGASVVLVARNLDHLQKAEQEVRAAGAPATWVSVCDVSQEDQVKATVDGTFQRFNRWDVMVNNAGIMVFKKFEDHTVDDWINLLRVDLLGAFMFTKQAFLRMKPGGAIVNISSVHAVETTPNVSSYAAAKAAILSLTRSASIEGKEKGLRVNAVLPGAIDTPMLWDNPNIKAGLEVINQSDVGKPEDIAAVVAYLASSDAEFVQGASLRVDGGRLARL